LVRFFVFFFQAEDGIRDLYVTGVQTCALPIFPRRDCFACISGFSEAISSRNSVPPWASSKRPGLRWYAPVKAPFSWPKSSDSTRSEERRVGKEGRSRWVQYQ